MTGLCGWLGQLPEGAAPEPTLRAMAGGLGRPPGGPGALRAASDAGLYVQGWPGCHAWHADDEIWTALDGSPRWRGHALARLADAQGHGAALHQAYRDHGADLLQQLHGPFSLAVLDRRAGRALLAIDRFGVHRLCYSTAASGPFVFGTTTDALRRHPAISSTIPSQSIFNFLYFYVSPGPKTVYAEQAKLLPGHCVGAGDGPPRAHAYWRMPYREQRPAGRPDALAEQLRDLLHQAVARASADTPSDSLGAFLSGGLDSSTVLAMMKRLRGGHPKSFTIGFEAGGYDETSYARIAARHFDSEHHEHLLTPAEVIDLLPRIAETYDEPFGNSSAIPAFYCARMAKQQGVGLMLAGDGGDEIFAGNARYARQMRLAAYGRIPRALRAHLIEPLVCASPLKRHLGLIERADGYIARARTPMPDRLESFNLLGRIDLAEVFEPDVLAAIDQTEPLRLVREAYGATDSPDMLHRMLALDLKQALADNDLRKVGGMCALAGVQVRYPFLDEDLAEFAAGIPPELMLKGGRLRHFYKQALDEVLPREVLNKQKHGFGMPFAEWLRQDRRLRDLAHDSLQSFRRRGYLRADFLDRLLATQADGRTTANDGLLWDLTMLEMWLQVRAPGAQGASTVQAA